MAGGAFFTNGCLPALTALLGTERLPADLAAGGSEWVTPVQLAQYAYSHDLSNVQYATDTSAVGFTVAAAKVAGGKLVVLNLTGALGAGAALTMPSAADLVAAIPGAFVGESYQLRFLNNSAGAFSWTITGNASVTVNGTATVGQNTYRDYQVTLTSLTAVAMQNIGSGGN